MAKKILIVNTSFPELDQLAAGLAEVRQLSVYVCPYANLGRRWERFLGMLPGFGKIYTTSFGRRRMPHILPESNVREAGVAIDFLMTAHGRLPSTSPAYKSIHRYLMDARTRAVARKAEGLFADEYAVVASWGCAEPVFHKAKAKGALCVLNYPLAHHRFTQSYLQEEAERMPAFTGTLNSHERPKWLERQLDTEIELADHILLGSSFARDSFLTEGVPPEKLTVIPYGADISLFKPIPRKMFVDSGLRLLFVGQIGQRKGISYLLEAIRRTADKGDSLTLVGQIQADGRPLEPYQELFRHVPHVPRNDLPSYYREADVFVFPTLVEGMGLVVLEAMSSGLPVITTPNGPGDIVRDGVDGFLIPPRDVEAIVDCLQRLRADPELRIKMGMNARKRAQKFTWNKYRMNAICTLRNWLDTLHAPFSTELPGDT